MTEDAEFSEKEALAAFKKGANRVPGADVLPFSASVDANKSQRMVLMLREMVFYARHH